MEGCFCLKPQSDVLESLSGRAMTKTSLQPEGESYADLAKPVSPSFAMNIPLWRRQPCLSPNIHSLSLSREDVTAPETYTLPNDTL